MAAFEENAAISPAWAATKRKAEKLKHWKAETPHTAIVPCQARTFSLSISAFQLQFFSPFAFQPVHSAFQLSVFQPFSCQGKPTGFIEYLRELPVDRPPLDRVRDWNEFHPHMEQKEAPQPGCPLHGLRRALLPYRQIDQRHGLGLPDP